MPGTDDRAVTGRLARRYLDSVERALVNEHYLENEVRLAHLADCLERPKPVELPRLRDPVRHDVEAFERLRRTRRTGPQPGDPPPTGYAYAPGGRLALDGLVGLFDGLRAGAVTGDLAACGVGRGGTAILLRALLEAHGDEGRTVWVVDRFRAAAPDRSAPDEDDGLAELRPDLNQVRDGFARFDLLDDRVRFLQGDPRATLPDAPIGELALLHVGADVGEDLEAVLEELYPRLAVGGAVVVEDVADEADRATVDRFRTAHGIEDPAVGFGVAGTSWQRTAPDRIIRPSGPAATGVASVPLAPAAPDGDCELSVVIVLYGMRREAARSLRALSRAYQRDIDDLAYEVVVVENGSPPDQVLGEAYVRSFGPEFRYLDLGAEATSSPAPALNRGIAASVGRNLALMVDGAHVITPGTLHHAVTGLRAYAPAVVAIQPWYLGPGQQGEAMRSGYDQAAEDALFANIAWPGDGYRLFEIGHFQGDRDWLDGLWESNCLFAPRSLVEQVGGFDEGFDSAGGGYTNLDIYERLGAAPGVNLVSVLGEGSFHQVHGGTTTNQADPAERRARVFSYGERYAALRGRPFSGPEKPIRYVGGFHGDASRRTRARRMTGAAFDVDARIEGADGPARHPVAIPDDQRDGFVAAYWRSLAWQETTWLGLRTPNAPADLLAYQDIIHEVRPDWIVETGTRHGGRAHFLASICDLVGHGRVLSIDTERAGVTPPPHPRITYLTGLAHKREVAKQAAAILGDHPNAFVILGSRGARRRMHREFTTYAPHVPVGSYVVMEHTVLNGYPVDASFGPGPFEATRRILNTRGDFTADTTRERHGVTFNPGGFLRRVR